MPIPSSTSVSDSASGGRAPHTQGSTGRLRDLPTIRWTVTCLLVAECLVSLVAPTAVPARTYLKLYLGRESLERTRVFLEDKHPYLIWDPVTGWRNRPNSGRGFWHVDSLGGRTSSASMRGRRGRSVLFLGDSITNGATGVTNDETISAYFEDDRTTCFNFATMSFGVDQIYLGLKEQLSAYTVEAIVVGIGENSIDALGNRYLPFRETSTMPYFKPRFALRGGSLQLIAVPPREAYADLLNEANVLSDLENTDDYYPRFARYPCCGFLPLSGFACLARDRVVTGASAARGELPYFDLLAALMHEIVRDGTHRGARVIFMVHPNQDDTFPGRLQKWLPDRYAGLISELRKQGFAILDVREALRRSGKPASALFMDEAHYRPEGNRVVALAVRQMIPHPLSGPTISSITQGPPDR
jgi:hypothetical protein